MRTDSIRLTRENPLIALKSQCNWNGSGEGEQWIDLIICEMQCLHAKRKTAAAISNRYCPQTLPEPLHQSHWEGKVWCFGFVDSSVTSIQTRATLFIQWNTKGGIVAVLKCCNCDQTLSQDKSPNKAAEKQSVWLQKLFCIPARVHLKMLKYPH